MSLIARLKDPIAGYGWISIALHWLGALAVIALLFIGSSIGAEPGMLRLHTSVAFCAYAILWARVIWRLIQGHPAKSPKQGPIAFAVGKWLHFAMVLAVAVMLLSGPFMAWTGGIVIGVFDWFEAPNVVDVDAEVHLLLRKVHATTAGVLASSVVLHVVVVIKHMAFHNDGTLERIMVPPQAGA